jgi:hypothetical protein
VDLIDFLMLPLAAAGALAYVCRLDALRVGRHSLMVIAMHIALGAACILAGYHAWSGETEPIDIAAVIGALAWIRLSLPTWREGKVPRQFETAPAPLDEAER